MDVVHKEASTMAIEKMKDMLEALTSKLSCNIGPWKRNSICSELKSKNILTELPIDVDSVES